MSATPTSPIRLGLMPPLSGLVALYGPEISWAGRIARDEVNAAGGVLGQPLELVIEDDGSLPETAVPAARRLVEQHGCAALIGNLLSNSRIAVASEVADAHGIPYLNFSFYEGSIQSRWFFHFAALPNQQIDPMIPAMMRLAGPKMFFAGSNYEWPRGSIDAALRALRAQGGDAVGEEYLPIGSARIESLLEHVERSGADVFVPYFAGEDQIRLLNEFARRGLKERMAVVMGHYDEAMVGLLAPEVREGFYSTNTYFMSLDTPANRRYLAALAARPEIDGIWPRGRGVLTNFGEGAWLCVHAFAQAANRAGSLDPEALAAALERTELEGPQGWVHMDPDTHHAHVNTCLARCRFDGTFEIVERFGCRAPRIPERYQPRVSPPGLLPVSRLSADPERPTAPPAANRQPEAAGRILDVADIAVLSVSADGLVLDANRRASELFGYRPGELSGRSVHDLVPPGSRALHAAHLRRFLEGSVAERRMGKRGELNGYRKDGSLFPVEASIARFQSDGEWILVATLRDITDRRIAEEELVWRATHDTLTGLPNRAMIRDRLAAALNRSRKHGHGVALLFIDLDGFKLINDTQGHALGDELLKEVARRLIAHVRPGDTVARLGGDEFVILCDRVEQPAAVASLADRLNDALREPLTLAGQRLFVTASIGLALGHGMTHGADDLLRNADAAMYVAKEQGRDGWRFFSEEIHEQAQRKLNISNGLRQAIDNDELRVLFQPILCADSQLVRGAELLLRWHPPGGEISPAHFIPIAEISGSIVPIGRWVLREACRAEVDWRTRLGSQAPYVSVNVSVRQLNDEGLVEDFKALLAETGADPTRLLLEVTETSLMSDVASNLSVLNRLADLGPRIAVDDFGTGYSSLAQLLRLPVSKLKIDREFVDGLDKRQDSRSIVSAVCGMARVMGLRTIAEGVENIHQFEYLRDLGCDAVQGFYFHRPLSAEDLIAAVRERAALGPQVVGSDLYQALYVSLATRPLSRDELNDLLLQSRDFNRGQGITGFLLYFNGSFMQMLEGAEERVRRLLERIRTDPRHDRFKTVFEGRIERRTFADWSMGFRNMDDREQRAEFPHWREQAINFLDLAGDPRACRALISAFARS